MEKNVLIELKNVKKSYDGKTNVIEQFDLQVMEGEFVTFLGPSGCGKTTILRMIGGFETPSSGEILLDGKDIGPLPPNERPVNTVFQKYALFPHLNVYDNIAFGLKLKKMSKEETREKVRRALEIVDLEGFEKRKITTLSGGQQQRIAIARAIVNEPRVLLLDEPLSALDYKMRKEMQIELKNMHKKLGITFIFVTHDQEEALTMSDKVVVLADGEIQQIGTPEEIYNEPSNVFVADFIGESNIFNGVMKADKVASFAGGTFPCVDDFAVGTKIDAVIRPEDVDIVSPSEGQLKGEITMVDFKGTFYVMFVQCGQFEMEIHTLKQYKVGEEIGLKIEPDMIHIIPYDTSKNHFNGTINGFSEDKGLHITFADITMDVPFEKIFPTAKVSDGALVSEGGSVIETSGVEIVAWFDPAEAEMSDDVSDATVTGKILSFYYIGDHYSYIVRSKTEEDYVVDHEDLWNVDDYVGVSISQDIMHFELVK